MESRLIGPNMMPCMRAALAGLAFGQSWSRATISAIKATPRLTPSTTAKTRYITMFQGIFFSFAEAALLNSTPREVFNLSGFGKAHATQQ
jgi:hypothetical protein